MKFGVCTTSLIPLRSSPDHKSEMVNQILFGDLYQIFDTNNEWAFVSLSHDGYQGWIHQRRITFISEDEFKYLHAENKRYSLELMYPIQIDDFNQPLQITLGSTIFGTDKPFQLKSHSYSFHGLTTDPSSKPDRQNIIGYAQLFMNTPYLWGGRSVLGIDCSGLSQMAYKMAGIEILRDASQQAEIGETINFLSEAKIGDLVFFDNDEGIIDHVGILISNTEIIHSSGKVQIDHIDHQGIFSLEEKKYTHKLRMIKSIF